MDIRAVLQNIRYSISTTRNWRSAIKKFFWLYNKKTGKGSSTLIKFCYPPPIGDLDLRVRYNHQSDSFIMSEVFSLQCYRIPLSIDIKCIMDLGANAGFTAVYFSKLFPKATIACVEPMPGNIEVLKENLALNAVNSVVFEVAATVEDEEILMEIGDRDYANRVAGIGYGKDIGNPVTAIKGLSVNTMINQLGWEKVDLIKIDIEGYEGLLLRENNDWLAKVEVIIMEIHEGVTIDFVKQTTALFGFNYISQEKGNWILSKRKLA